MSKNNKAESSNVTVMSAPVVEIVESPIIQRAIDNGLPVLTIVVCGATTQVVYTPNMRFSDFMKHNSIADNTTATPLYNEAKRVNALEQSKRIDALTVQDVKQSAKWKNGVFVIESASIRQHNAEADSISDTFLIRQWAAKKALESQKAQERANGFLAMRDAKLAKVA